MIHSVEECPIITMNGTAGQQADALHGHSARRVFRGDPVGDASGDQDSDEGEQMRVEHRVETGSGQIHVETFVEIGGHPGQIPRQHEDQSGETERQNECRRSRENDAESFGETGFLLVPPPLFLSARSQDVCGRASVRP